MKNIRDISGLGLLLILFGCSDNVLGNIASREELHKRLNGKRIESSQSFYCDGRVMVKSYKTEGGAYSEFYRVYKKGDPFALIVHNEKFNDINNIMRASDINKTGEAYIISGEELIGVNRFNLCRLVKN